MKLWWGLLVIGVVGIVGFLNLYQYDYQNGEVSVIMSLATSSAEISISDLQDQALRALDENNVRYSNYYRYESFPYLALHVEMESLEILRQLPIVTTVYEDGLSHPL